MKPKVPTCAFGCESKRAPILVRVMSRVYAEWDCPDCGSSFRTDVVTGKLIARLNTAAHLEGEVSV